MSRIAIVTGGSRGIGRGVAEAFLGEGWKVWTLQPQPGIGRRAPSVSWELRRPGRSVDVRDQGQVEAFVKEVLDAEGRIDCLVNNAGLGHFAPVDELYRRPVPRGDRDQPERLLLLHPGGVPGHEEAGRAAGSSTSRPSPPRTPSPGGGAYNASKFGLLGLSEAAMLDLRPHGIRVASILPGSVATEFAGGHGQESWKLQPADIAADGPPPAELPGERPAEPGGDAAQPASQEVAGYTCSRG